MVNALITVWNGTDANRVPTTTVVRDSSATTTQAVGTGVQRTTHQAFDAVGNVQATQDALGNWATNVYDVLNRRTGTLDALGDRTTSAYDAVGSVSSEQDALGKLVTYAYDALHRRVSVKDQLGNLTTTVLDAAGRDVAEVNPLLFVQRTGYDALGQKTGAWDPAGNYTQWANDGSGGTRLVTDPVGNETRYAADGLGRQAAEIDPTGAAATTTFDAVGRASEVKDRDGRTIDFSYDNGDRVTGEVWKNNAGVTVNVVTYAYDTNDNRTSAADYSGTVTYSYDALNQEQSYTNVFGQVLTYTHDGNGNVTLRQDSLGGVLTSVYDANRQLTSRQFGGSGQTPVRIDLGYDGRGEQTSKTWFSDLAGTNVIGTSMYAFDDARRVTGITNKNNVSATLSYYDYTYDTASRATSQTWWSQIGTTTYSGTATYTYDCTGGQLRADGTATYTYDGNGNRNMAGYQTGPANRMTNDGTFTYTYDAQGNTQTKSKGTGLETWYYGWDNRNRLTSVRETTNGTTNELTVTYTYDVENNLVQQDKWKTGGSTATTRYAYDGSNVWADLDGTNAVITRYVFGDRMDEILTRTVSSGVNAGMSAYITDNLGSIRDLVISSGAVNDHIDYSGFGIATETTASAGDRMKFQGRWDDLDTGTANYRGRDELISDGRFMNPDPSGLGADSNPIRFVGNNPTNATDPSGLKAELSNVKLGASISSFGVDTPDGLIKGSVDYSLGAAYKKYSGSGHSSIFLSYTGRNANKVSIIQFYDIELEYKVRGNQTWRGVSTKYKFNVGIDRPNNDISFSLPDDGSLHVPRFVDSQSPTSPEYAAVGIGGNTTNKAWLFDSPATHLLSMAAAGKLMKDNIAVTDVRATFHFVTVFAINKKAFAYVQWNSESLWNASKNKGFLWGINPGSVGVISKPRFSKTKPSTFSGFIETVNEQYLKTKGAWLTDFYTPTKK